MESQSSAGRQPAAPTSPGPPRARPFDESWVEVSSQPSSSSLSSIGDEIVTTGLRVGGPYPRRRRLAQPLPQQQPAGHGAGTSSQDEYDESDSDEGRLLTSSAEDGQAPQHDGAGDDSDDGDDATALGRASHRPVFRPPPNAFSHPTGYAPPRSHSATSAMPPHPHGGFTRRSFPQRPQTRARRAVPSFMSPSSAREDNDEALRASLTTLLSCAAAARGLPKTRDEAEARRLGGNGVGPSNQPMELRLVQESELAAAAADTAPPPPPSGALSPLGRASPERSPSRVGGDKSKRAVPAGRSPRATKKRTATAAADDGLISPTLLTWVVSAGVVVLVSVVGFGAGYVIGREVGRQEVLSASVSGVNETTTQCGREVIGSSGGGLRRLRWGVVGRSIVAQA